MDTIWVVTSGDGSDGSEYEWHAVYTTEEKAKEYVRAHNAHRPDWAKLDEDAVVPYAVDVPFDPSRYPHDPKKAQR